MKRFKSLIYVLALALIFVGAASVTKASAAEPNLTWNTTAANVTDIAVYVGEAETPEKSGSAVVEADAVVKVEVSVDENYKAKLSGVDNPTENPTGTFTFTMPQSAVTLVITAAEAEEQVKTYSISKGQIADGAVLEVTVGENTAEATSAIEGDTVNVKYTAAGENVTVTAVYNDGSKDTAIDLDENGEGSFTMPAANVTITVTEEAATGGGGNEEEDDENVSATITAKATIYDEEKIEVTCGAQVYYQVLKKLADVSKLKATGWVPAAKGDNGNYYIDFSGTSNSKDVYIAMTTNRTEASVEEENIVTIDAAVKSIKASLNYKTEDVDPEAGLADVIASLNIKQADTNGPQAEKAVVAADATAANEVFAKDANAVVVSVKWKRGVNGNWKNVSDFKTVDWDMLKASNATLYLTVNGEYKKDADEVKVTAFRMSKEAKVKIPKAAKAPSVKTDFVKGTLTLKNGMQIRVKNNGAWTDWMDICALATRNETAKGAEVFALATEGYITSTKVSKVAVSDLVKAVEDCLELTVEPGATLECEVRTAATAKKFMSVSAPLEIVLPAAKATKVAEGESASLTYTDGEEPEFKFKFSDLFTPVEGKEVTHYEFLLMPETTTVPNYEKAWTKIDKDEQDWSSNIDKKFKCLAKDSTGKAQSINLVYVEAKAIAIRIPAEKPQGETKGTFASETLIIPLSITETEVTPPSDENGDDDEGNQGNTGEGNQGNTGEGNQGNTGNETPDQPVETKHTLTNAAGNALTATFKINDDAVTDANEGDTVEIEFTPDAEKVYTVSYTVGEGTEEQEVTANAGKYTFTMPAGNVVVKIVEVDNSDGE